MPKIYISYNNKDNLIAQEISSWLKGLGYELAIDVDILSAGVKWQEELSNALKASDVFIALLTENSISSQYVLYEIGVARAYAQSSKMLVIPVLFSDIPIPNVIRDLQVIYGLPNDIAKVKEQINQAIALFMGKKTAEEENKAAEKRKIEANAGEYINEAIESLGKNEKRNRWIGISWYIVGFLTLVIGILFGFCGLVQVNESTDLQWIKFAFLSLKSIIVIGLLIGCSRYAFTLGKSYMSESLKSADRIHAISFGKFYLGVYSEKIEWAELKEVFQHWNIDKASSFSSLEVSQYDPKLIESVVEIAKTVINRQDPKK